MLLSQVAAVLLADATAVDDTSGLGNLRGYGFGQPLADSSVDFLRLLGGGDLAGTNCPEGGIIVRQKAWFC